MTFPMKLKRPCPAVWRVKPVRPSVRLKIDVPEFRSRFLQLYHTRYLRPVRDHLVATVETYAPLMARAPKTFNFFY